MTPSDASNPADPFREARREKGVLECEFQGRTLPMILRHADVRSAAKDWKTFSSDAPFRVPIPSEEAVRSIRQLPIETDPPQHTEYRSMVEPFFQRAKEPEVIKRVETLVDQLVGDALTRESLEVVGEFALPLQSRALTHLLHVAEEEAKIWIGWGIHVFKASSGSFKNENVLEDYLRRKFDEAEGSGGDDFFSALTRATFQGRPLTREEMMGFANLAFAGGRDTIIHTVSSIIAYLGRHPDGIGYLREDPRRIIHASEEFFRVFMPLTHIGRVCPHETDVHGVAVAPDERVSLCWASANHDETIFEAPDEIRLDRKPNPHLSFGFGPHLCLGAPHARLIVRSLLKSLTLRLDRIEILDAVPHVEHEARYTRSVGFDLLRARFHPVSAV